MPAIHTWVIIGFIIISIAIIIRIVAEKSHKNQFELAALGIIPIIGSLFGDSETTEIRAAVIGFSFLIYLAGTAICHFVVWLWKMWVQHKAAKGEGAPPAGLTVVLPVDAPFRIDQNFIDNLPADVDSLTHMCNEIGILTTEFTSKFPNLGTDQERETTIRSYFLGICYHILDLFDDTVRVHVRILSKHSEGHCTYDKYVATYNKNEYPRAMQPMSADNQMIQTSYKQGQSLIASLNKTLCEPGSSHKWRNFLTFALRSITYEGKPVFSMGISTARAKTDRLFFLNYCSIEAIIENYVDLMVNTAGCKEFIIKHYFLSS